jgi:hypothetical protein
VAESKRYGHLCLALHDEGIKMESCIFNAIAVFNFTEAINGIIQMSSLFKTISRGPLE